MINKDDVINFNEILSDENCDIFYEKIKDLKNHFYKEIPLDTTHSLFEDEEFYEGEEKIFLREEYRQFPEEFSIPYNIITQAKELEKLEILCECANYKMVFSPFLIRERILELESFYTNMRLSGLIGELDLRKLNEINPVKVGLVTLIESDD